MYRSYIYYINNKDLLCNYNVNSYILKWISLIIILQSYTFIGINLADETDIKLSEIGNKIHIVHFNMLISFEDWDNVLNYNDVNKAYESFNNIISRLRPVRKGNVTGSFKNHN